LPVDALWGVGPVTARKLHEHGISRLVDVRATDLDTLRGIVGSLADWLKDLAEGKDSRAVEPDRPSKSSGSECTYEHDLTNRDEIHREIAEMAGDGAAWLAKLQLFARTVTIKVRYADFDTVTRSHSAEPTRDLTAITARALALLEKTEAGVRPVRLLGVSMHNLTETTNKPERPARPGAGPRLPFDDEA
jgi:DNA polymerase IV